MKKDYTRILELQNELSKKWITHDDLININISNVCGIDVSYKDLNAFCSAVVVNKNTLEVIESVNEKSTVNHPYIPGFFMLIDGKPLLRLIRLLKNKFDVLIIDGHGILHPRKCGLAFYVNITNDKPTIGVANNLLCRLILENIT
jgi:deoxyribonuclease V